MDEITALAAAETIAILNQTEISLVTKIPYAIIRALHEKAQEYTKEIEIDVSLGFSEQNISEEAQTILAIIYKDYWCDKEKAQEMNKKIQDKAREYEQEQMEKLNPFKDSIQNKQECEISNSDEMETTALIVLPKKWYVRIFDKIMRFFRKK